MKKNFLKVAAILCCTSLFQLTPTFAAENEKVDLTPEEIVLNYFEAVKDKDYDRAVDILREENLSKKEQKQELKEIMSDESTAVASVDNVVVTKAYDDYIEVNVRNSYEDGTEEEGPILLKREDDGNYILKRVVVDPDSNEIDQDDLNAIIESEDDTISEKARYSQTQLVDWDFSQEAGDTKYSDTFSVSNIKYLRANVSTMADVTIQVVKKKVGSDTKLTDSSYLSGDEDSQRTNLYIKDGNSVKNAKLRIYFESDGYCYGELYAIK